MTERCGDSRPEELTGLPPDPDCLHCVLGPYLQSFLDAHPGKPLAEIVLELNQITGEFIASTAPDAACAVRVSRGAGDDLMRFVRKIAVQYQAHKKEGH